LAETETRLASAEEADVVRFIGRGFVFGCDLSLFCSEGVELSGSSLNVLIYSAASLWKASSTAGLAHRLMVGIATGAAALTAAGVAGFCLCRRRSAASDRAELFDNLEHPETMIVTTTQEWRSLTGILQGSPAHGRRIYALSSRTLPWRISIIWPSKIVFRFCSEKLSQSATLQTVLDRPCRNYSMKVGRFPNQQPRLKTLNNGTSGIGHIVKNRRNQRFAMKWANVNATNQEQQQHSSEKSKLWRTPHTPLFYA
jgi:hypothetical protein